MRYAMISDIHGNFPALKAVLDDAKTKEIDYYIFLGDYALCFPSPNGVMEAIREIPNKYVIKGNQEDYLIDIDSENSEKWEEGQLSSLYWCYNILTDENKKYLLNLPNKIEFKDGDITIHIFHDARNYITNNDIIKISTGHFPDNIFAKQCKKDEYLSILEDKISNLKLRKNTFNTPAEIYLFGHNHLQYTIRDSEAIYANPGSCGYPLDYSGFASYSILDISDTNISVEELRIPYDIRGFDKYFRNSDLYKNSRVFSEIMISSLHTGIYHLNDFFDFIAEYADSINDTKRPYSLQTWEDAYELWIKSSVKAN